MDCQDLFNCVSYWGSWASLISVPLALISILLVTSVKKALAKYKTGRRIESLIYELTMIPDDVDKITPGTKAKIKMLVLHVKEIRLHWIPLYRFPEKRVLHHLAKEVTKKGNTESIKEFVKSIQTFLE
jgi:hypothetical protein